MLEKIQKATPESLKMALFTQAYAAFLLAQRINFMWNRDENQAPLVSNLRTHHDSITWLIDGEEYYFEDSVQVAWLYALSRKLAELGSKKKVDEKSLFNSAWTIRLFLDDCANTMPQSALESDSTTNEDFLLKASTIAIYNTQILDSIINLGIFKSPPKKLRARYIETMISLFPEREKLYIPPLNNEITIKKTYAPPYCYWPLRKRTNALLNGKK